MRPVIYWLLEDVSFQAIKMVITAPIRFPEADIRKSHFLRTASSQGAVRYQKTKSVHTCCLLVLRPLPPSRHFIFHNSNFNWVHLLFAVPNWLPEFSRGITKWTGAKWNGLVKNFSAFLTWHLWYSSYAYILYFYGEVSKIINKRFKYFIE